MCRRENTCRVTQEPNPLSLKTSSSQPRLCVLAVWAGAALSEPPRAAWQTSWSAASEQLGSECQKVRVLSECCFCGLGHTLQPLACLVVVGCFLKSIIVWQWSCWHNRTAEGILRCSFFFCPVVYFHFSAYCQVSSHCLCISAEVVMLDGEFWASQACFSCALLLQLVLEHRTPSASPPTTLRTWILRSPPTEQLCHRAPCSCSMLSWKTAIFCLSKVNVTSVSSLFLSAFSTSGRSCSFIPQVNTKRDCVQNAEGVLQK